MKNTVKEFRIIALAVIIAFSMAACNKGGSSGSANAQSGGGKTLNSAEALKEYLDSQPVNGPDKPIRVSMTINDPMLESVADVIKSAGKYVSLNITGNALTTIRGEVFRRCTTLTSITIPNSVTKIERRAFSLCSNLTIITIPNSVTKIESGAFEDCTSLTSVTFQGTIDPNNLGNEGLQGQWFIPFGGDLRDKYLAGGIGTYTTTAPVNWDSKWTKQ
jgi:hypothetical protein